MNFIEPNKGINSGNYTITLINSAQLVCRIAGQSGTGANVIGLHTPIIIADEVRLLSLGNLVRITTCFKQLGTWT